MLEAIAERLRQAVPELRQAETAAAYAALDAAPPRARCPAAYVIETETSAEPNAILAGAWRQRLTERMAVVLFVDASRTAASPVGDLRPLRDAVRAALVGFVPADGAEPLSYLGGRLIGAENGYLVWQEEFASAANVKVPT